ncbi:MAG: hypothetical protein PHO08_00385 [Methylococcales bacterium]|nr:hypothetical protein [Methylococcales bacterium]
MNDTQLETLDQVRQFLEGTEAVGLSGFTACCCSTIVGLIYLPGACSALFKHPSQQK